MTDAEAMALADIPDWWVGDPAEAKVMRTLREALGAEPRRGLFRPGGFGKASIWLSGADLERVQALLAPGASLLRSKADA